VQLFNGAVKEQRKARLRHGHARRGRKTAIYRTWLRMYDRCYNRNYHSFACVGGRGIKVCPRWHSRNPQGFRNFLSDISEPPAKGLSLARINTRGHYSPSNCHWASIKQQANNQRRPLGRTRRRGVRLTSSGTYRAALYRNGKRYHLGIFATPTEASAAYQLAATTP
jgi:hypothetical protein